MCFELNALALAAQWSSRTTCPTAIAFKPPRPNPDPTFVAERSTMHVRGRGEGRYLNEMGRIWGLNHFCRSLCWCEGGIMQLWRSADILVIVTTIFVSCFVSFSKERSPRWSPKSRQDHWHFASVIWIFRGQAFQWGNACPGLNITVVLHLRANKSLG